MNDLSGSCAPDAMITSQHQRYCLPFATLQAALSQDDFCIYFWPRLCSYGFLTIHRDGSAALVEVNLNGEASHQFGFWDCFSGTRLLRLHISDGGLIVFGALSMNPLHWQHNDRITTDGAIYESTFLIPTPAVRHPEQIDDVIWMTRFLNFII